MIYDFGHRALRESRPALQESLQIIKTGLNNTVNKTHI